MTASALRTAPEQNSYERLRPGPGQSRPDVIASQRARLQRAMIELIARDGLAGITVRRLTKLAKVSTGSFYARFSGTDDCLLETYRELMAGVALTMGATRSAELDPREQVRATLRAMSEGLGADRDVARFALIEIYGGGPLALSAVEEQTRRLEFTLRRCLERRGRRIADGTAMALVAASLRCLRMELIEGSPEKGERTVEELLGWAADVVDGIEDLPLSVADVDREASLMGSSRRPDVLRSGGRPEEDLIVSAVLRLVAADGYFSLSPRKVSAAAGVPAARLCRHFSSVTDAYLAGIRRTCRSFFIELTVKAESDSMRRPSLRSALRRTWGRAAKDPAGARLIFDGIVEPGVAGLTCREALISELAAACDQGAACEGSRVPVRAEARAASLWAFLAEVGAAPPRRA